MITNYCIEKIDADTKIQFYIEKNIYFVEYISLYQHKEGRIITAIIYY
ncbi:hypothetical protein EZS27_005020 [termite gut metagenome]|uniref:Uncharacterized protein n=1 Tax=termite gut metagenome TaxID=433724 RepID=A0A5J4SP20_9ZZZZ